MMLGRTRRVQLRPGSGQGAARSATVPILAGAVIGASALVAGGRAATPALTRGAPDQSVAVQALAMIRFYGGVCTLVALSLTVAAGLLASERVLLGARQRVWVQSAHRTLSALAVMFLVTHVLTEVTAHRIEPVAAALPFLTTSLYLGFGSVAGYLMLVAMWTGLVRVRFAGAGRPWLWRVLHAAGYLCWPVALLHGLRAGRHPAVWVTRSYLVLLALVTIAAAVRLAAEWRRRRARAVRVVPGLRHPPPPGRVAPPPSRVALPLPGPPPSRVAPPLSGPPGRVAPPLPGPPGRVAPPAPQVARRRLLPSAPPAERDLSAVADLDARRRSRRGGPSATARARRDVLDEAEERYLAALRGEAR